MADQEQENELAVNDGTICDYCGRATTQAGPVVEGTANHRRACICAECAVQCGQMLEQEARKKQPLRQQFGLLPTPKEIVQHLESFVVGQGNAKRKLAVAVSNHYRRLLDNEHRRNRDTGTRPEVGVYDASLTEVAIQKANLLLIGPTGTGKTLLAKSLAKKLDVPFAMADATTLTEAGYVGDDVETVLQRLFVSAGYDLQATQRGIVYIDEIDKIARKGRNVNAGGKPWRRTGPA